MRPAYPACRRYLSGRPAVLVASLDCPMIATDCGASRTCASDGARFARAAVSSLPPPIAGEGWGGGAPDGELSSFKRPLPTGLRPADLPRERERWTRCTSFCRLGSFGF